MITKCPSFLTFRTRNNQLVCGNALCLAKLQFEGRHPHTIRKLHSSFEKVVQERNLLSAKEYKEKLGKSLFSRYFDNKCDQIISMNFCRKSNARVIQGKGNVGPHERVNGFKLKFLHIKLPNKTFPYLRVFQNLKKNLECIICIDIPENACKIFSCLNGHAICEMCLKRVIECPLCKISYRQVNFWIKVREDESKSK